MSTNDRILRLERGLATTATGERRCRVCDDGTKFRPVVLFDDEPAPWNRGAVEGSGVRAPRCPGCGRENTLVVRIRAVDPNAL